MQFLQCPLLNFEVGWWLVFSFLFYFCKIINLLIFFLFPNQWPQGVTSVFTCFLLFPSPLWMMPPWDWHKFCEYSLFIFILDILYLNGLSLFGANFDCSKLMFISCQDVTQRHEVSKCCWKNGNDKLAWYWLACQ